MHVRFTQPPTHSPPCALTHSRVYFHSHTHYTHNHPLIHSLAHALRSSPTLMNVWKKSRVKLSRRRRRKNVRATQMKDKLRGPGAGVSNLMKRWWLRRTLNGWSLVRLRPWSPPHWTVVRGGPVTVCHLRPTWGLRLLLVGWVPPRQPRISSVRSSLQEISSVSNTFKRWCVSYICVYDRICYIIVMIIQCIYTFFLLNTAVYFTYVITTWIPISF